jgi:macrolide transport system ATP-binding/permease protein
MIILADEPTGALDSKSGEELLDLLRELHADGRTIVLITHDPAIAAQAERVIQIRDGSIVADSGAILRAPSVRPPRTALPSRHSAPLADIAEATKTAFRSLRANLFRTLLTLLGVVIGVAAVVVMLAIGNGSQQQVLDRISAMGTNLLIVRPGAPGVRSSGDTATLVREDADAIAELPNVEAAVPERNSRVTLRVGNIDYQTSILGTAADYTATREWDMASGGFITDDDVRGYAPVIVLGQTVARNLYPDGEDPVGRYVLVRNVPMQVIGVLAPKGATPFGNDQDDIAVVPLTTGFVQLFGRQYLSTVSVKVTDATQIDQTEAAIDDLLKTRHRTVDFQVRNTASILATAQETQSTLTLLLASVAAVSLLVGGIGVMNIMLVNVTERRREIGIRMATGARMLDILLQFNTEALVVCGVGGLIGVAIGFGLSVAAEWLGFPIQLSLGPALLAFTCAFLTGLLFGFLPARKAARLDPVIALASE